MRSYDEVIASARDEAPFSNGTEGYGTITARKQREASILDELDELELLDG